MTTKEPAAAGSPAASGAWARNAAAGRPAARSARAGSVGAVDPAVGVSAAGEPAVVDRAASGHATAVDPAAAATGRRAAAIALGARLADDLDDPGAFVREATAGLASLAEPAYLAGQRRVAPGIGPLLGVRNPVLDGVDRSLARELRGVRAGRILPIAEALARADLRELRWLALRILGRIVRDEPELAWQVVRRIAREADDWITIDTTAWCIAPAILAEPYRWSELEQLVYSPSRWERRLVGATIASMALSRHAVIRAADMLARSLELLGLLVGDAAPEVQKSLSWALRNLARIDRAVVAAFCRTEAAIAATTGDGHRAWVLRDTLAKLPPADAATVRASLDGIRRTPGAPSTSRAARTAADFVLAGPDLQLPGNPLSEPLVPGPAPTHMPESRSAIP